MPMRRPLSIIAACAVAGVLLNLGVTMLCAWHYASSERTFQFGIVAWPAPVPADWPSPQDGTMTTTATLGFSERRIYSMGNSHTYELVTHSFGWPFRSMSCDLGHREHFSDWPMDAGPMPGWRGGWRSSPRSWLTIPLVPVWPGFFLNTAIFGWMTFAGARFLVRVRAGRRAGRGECVRCRYPVAGLKACPECGTAADVRASSNSST